MRFDLRKLSYSNKPWRIGLLDADGRFQPLPYAAFPRKRDGLPVLAQLQALDAPWEQPWTQWPSEVLDQVHAIIEGTETYQHWAAVVQRQADERRWAP